MVATAARSGKHMIGAAAYLFGAQAVIAYGVPRLSADVDVTVKLEPDDP